MQTKKDVNLDLDLIKDSSSWDTLAEINNDTLEEINKQIALVSELRANSGKLVCGDIATAFDGLTLSFKDLLEETITLGTKHSTEVDTVIGENGVSLKFPVTYKVGDITNDDDAMLYINIASTYMSIQDKSTNLIALGWVDLFVKLKIPTDELSESIHTGLDSVKDGYNGTK